MRAGEREQERRVPGERDEIRDGPLRILIVHNRYRSASPSGENRVVDQESTALEQAGHQVERFERLSDEIEQYPWSRKALVPVQVIWSPGSARALDGVLRTFEPDVVHIHNLFPLLSPSVMQMCRRRGVPVVATIHNYRMICSNGALFRSGEVCRDCVGRLPLPAIRHGCYRGSALATVPLAMASVLQERIWRTMPSAYIFISRAQRSEFSSMGLPASRCFVKGNFVLPVAPKTTTEDLVVFIGRMTEDKGVPLLMQAWDLYETGGGQPGMRLALAGSGPLEDEVAGWAAERPTVDYLGLQTKEQCVSLLRRARAAVVPSQWPETFGLVVAEAMAAGVAPIASAHGSFPDLVTDGHDGVLFPPDDAKALTRVFVRMAESPAWFDQLGSNARGTYEKRYHPAANIRELERIYRFAIENPASSQPNRPPLPGALTADDGADGSVDPMLSTNR